MAEQYKPYVCTLDEASLKKAREELNEIPEDRMSSVENFRKLIKERAPHITCSMETEFLLRFLRVAKFSQLEALNRLEKYLELFNTMPEWLRDIDMMDPKVQEFLDVGYFYQLGFDEKGQQVCISNEGAFDPSKPGFSKNAMMKAMFGMMIHILGDERTVVNGVTGMGDLTHFSIKHQMFWTMEDMKKQSALMNGAWPTRWKGFIFYNHGPVFEVLWNMFKPFLKKKMKDRMHMCGSNLEDVYDKYVPMRLMPLEYLPDDYNGPNGGSVQDIIKSLKNELSKPEVVAKIKYETSNAFRLDESKRPKNDVPLQSFRKLNVD